MTTIGDTVEPVVATRPRIQRLLLSDEYFEFEELVLVEAAFAQVTRRGRGIRQVQIAVTPTKFIIATDELGGDDVDSLFYFNPEDPDVDTALEMVSIVPIECVNLSVFSRRSCKLKARFCNGKVYYFELSERGTLSATSAQSIWRQWEERIEFLCPNINSSSSETSVANSSSTLSTLERRRSLRQQARSGHGKVQVSWYARGSQMDGTDQVAGSQRADSSVWMTSDENEVAAARTRPVPFSKRKLLAPPAAKSTTVASTGATTTKATSDDSSATTCSTCTSGDSSTDSSAASTTTGTTTATKRTSKRPAEVPRLELGEDAASRKTPSRVESVDPKENTPSQPPKFKPEVTKRPQSQTLMVHRFGLGVEEKCTLNLYLSSDTALQLTETDRQRLDALTRVADDALHLWELSALARKRRHTRHSVFTPLAERQVGWCLLTPGARNMARVRRTASETRLGTVSVRRRICGQTMGAEFHLPLRRGDLCAAMSLPDMPAALKACRETVAAGQRLVFWKPEQTDRPVTGRDVYVKRLELLKEFRSAHERIRITEKQRAKEKKGKVARSLSKLSMRAKQSATSQAIKKTYQQVFRSISNTSKNIANKSSSSRTNDDPSGRRTVSESRLSGGGQASRIPQRQRSFSLTSPQRTRGKPNGDEAEKPSGSGGGGAFCRFLSPRKTSSGDEPEQDIIEQDGVSLRSETSETDDATSRATSLLPDSDLVSLAPSLLDSLSGTTGANWHNISEKPASDTTSTYLPGATALKRVREIDSTVLAHQLTLLDREMLSRVTPAHLSSVLVRRDPRVCEALVAIMMMFHRIIGLVTTNVLLEDTYRDRAKVITKLVTVAEKCYHLRNFHSAKAILSGLQTIPVYRLRQTWEYMKTKHDRKYRSFKSLSKLFSDTRLPYFQRVILDVVDSQEPFVPFFGDLILTVLGHNCLPRACWSSRKSIKGAADDDTPGSPVLSWVRAHFDPPPDEVAARRRVLQRKYATRWRAIVRRRRFCSRRFRPTWLKKAGKCPEDVHSKKRQRQRLSKDSGALANPLSQAASVASLWRQWRKHVEKYQLEERQMVREYLLLARHYTMETALGLSLDREPPEGSSCTLCSNTGMASDSSADPADPSSTL